MNDIITLRTALFDTLQRLRDPANPLEIDRARAIVQTAHAIINSARCEIDYMRQFNTLTFSGFFPAAEGGAAVPTMPVAALPDNVIPTAHGVKLVEKMPGGTVTTHRMR
jgi:hypothetical protein